MTSDEDQLLEVAEHLNSVNLPAVRSEIRQILELSEQSFSGAIADVTRHQYVFVLVDRTPWVDAATRPSSRSLAEAAAREPRERIVGTSMILAQLGRRDAPYIFVDVLEDERYSSTLDRHFHHTLLKVGYSYDGPTEIGGLILLPEYRRERLGQLVSYVRFAFLRMHRERFQDEVVAELLPPLEPDGTSFLWEALGKRFTGMSYAEADLLSKKNKEFIKGLFPESPIHASLLSPEAQAVIGKVGPKTRGVEKLLRRIGFRYAERVDPFDGGPHFVAQTDEITLLQQSFVTRVRGAGKAVPLRAVVAEELPQPPYFRAVLGSVSAAEGTELEVDASTFQHLALDRPRDVWVLPIE